MVLHMPYAASHCLAPARHGLSPITFFFFHVSCHCGACDLCRPPRCLPCYLFLRRFFCARPPPGLPAFPSGRKLEYFALTGALDMRSYRSCICNACFANAPNSLRRTTIDRTIQSGLAFRERVQEWWSFTWPAWPAAQRNLQITNRFMVPCNVSFFFFGYDCSLRKVPGQYAHLFYLGSHLTWHHPDLITSFDQVSATCQWPRTSRPPLHCFLLSLLEQASFPRSPAGARAPLLLQLRQLPQPFASPGKTRPHTLHCLCS